MKNKTISLIIGGFAIFLLLVYGVFSDILNGFVGAFGFGLGLILGILICLMIILAFLGKGGRR